MRLRYRTMKRRTKKALALLCVLAMGPALFACGGGTSGGAISTRGGNQPAQPPSGDQTPIQSERDPSLLSARWRANIELSGSGFICVYFYPNGEFTQEVRFVLSSTVFLWEEVFKGSYGASNGTLTLKYKSAEHHDYGKEWETTALPADRTLTYTFSEGALGQLYLDIANGGLPPFDEPVAPRGSAHDGMGITRFVRTDFDGPVWDR